MLFGDTLLDVVQRALHNDDHAVLPRLIAQFKIHPKKLNELDKKTNESALIWFAAYRDGFGWFDDDPELCDKISPLCLNSFLKDSPSFTDGISVTYYLAQDIDDYALIAKDPILRSRINKESFNHILVDDEFFQGASAVYHLIASRRGRDLLCNDARLRSLIAPEPLLSVVTNQGNKTSAAEILMKPEGQNLFNLLDDRLKSAIIKQKQPADKEKANTQLFFSHRLEGPSFEVDEAQPLKFEPVYL